MQPTPDRSSLQPPALGLAISAGLGLMMQCLLWCLSIFGIAVGIEGRGRDEDLIPVFVGLFVGSCMALLAGGFIIFGAWQMKDGKSHGLAMAASVIGVIPCFHPLGLLGVPFGIWALVVLNKAETKALFER